MGLFSLEYWSVLSFPSPGDLPDPGIEPGSSALQTDALPSEPQGSPQEYWRGLPCPPPGDLTDPGIKLVSTVSPAWAGVFFGTERLESTLHFGIVDF